MYIYHTYNTKGSVVCFLYSSALYRLRLLYALLIATLTVAFIASLSVELSDAGRYSPGRGKHVGFVLSKQPVDTPRVTYVCHLLELH